MRKNSVKMLIRSFKEDVGGRERGEQQLVKAGVHPPPIPRDIEGERRCVFRRRPC